MKAFSDEAFSESILTGEDKASNSFLGCPEKLPSI